MPFAPLYTFTQAETELQLRLGNRTDLGSGSANRIDQWLDNAQMRIAACMLACEDLDVYGFPFTTNDGQTVYGLLDILPPATDIVGIFSIRNDTTGVKVRRFPWQEYRSLNQQAQGPPMRWARWGYNLALDPQPDDAYDMLIDYRRNPQRGVTEIPNRFQEDWLHLAESMGWQSLMKPERAVQAFGRITANLQSMLSMVLDQDQFESTWDQDQVIAPIGMDWPYATG
jgi:hypothetical protein